MAVTEQNEVVAAPAALPQREVIYRHTVVVRLTHWINVLCLTLLLMSGLAILNYHPALYWGHTGYHGVPSFIAIGSTIEPGSGRAVGVTQIAGVDFDTTGVLGVSYDSNGRALRRAFPSWLALPSGPGLALARDWHFLAAWLFVFNGAVYLVVGLLSGHFRGDLVLASDQIRARHILTDIGNHLRLR